MCFINMSKVEPVLREWQLNWKLRKTTAVVFLHYYSEIIGRTGKVVFKLARAILDLCLQQVIKV